MVLSQNNLEKATDDSKNKFNKFVYEVESLEGKLEDTTKKFEDITSTIQNYNVILDELNSKEGLSAKSKQDIVTKYHELLPYINNEKELRKQLIEIIKREEEVQLQAYRNMLMYSEDFFNGKVKGNKDLVDKLGEYYNKDLENAKSLAEAKALVEERLIQNIAKQWAKFYQVSAIAGEGYVQTMGAGGMIDEFGQNMAQNMVNEMQKVSGLFNDIVRDFSSPDFKDINLSSVKEPKDPKKDNRQFLEAIDAEIRAIKLKNDNLIKTRDLLTEQLNLAKDLEGIEGLNKQYEITGQIIEHNEKLIKSFKEEQDAVHKRANDIRNQYSKYDAESWFDSNGEATVSYINSFNTATKSQQEEMSKVFGIVQALKKAWMEADSEVKNVLQTNKELTKELEKHPDRVKEAYKKELSDRLANSKNWIDKRKFYDDWGADNEIEAWERVRAYVEDYYKKGIISHKEYTDYILDIDKSLLAEHQRIEQERISAVDAVQEKLVAIIRKRGEEEKKILDDNHKSEMESLEERHKTRTQNYKDELDKFKAMIQGKIDALDEQYEEEDYLEQLSKEREKANELQKQIDVLSLDDSLTAKNKTIELRKQLAEQNDKIAKMQQKKERDTLKKSLQDQLKDKEKDIKDKENISNKLYENEKKRLEEDYRVNKEFLDRKYSDESVYAEAKSTLANKTFDEIYKSYETFENKFGKGMGHLGEIIKNDFIKQLELAKQALDTFNSVGSFGGNYNITSPTNQGSKSQNNPKYTVEDYGKFYMDARAKGDWQTMEWANRQANILRGIGDIVTSAVDIESIKKKYGGSFKNGAEILSSGLMLTEFHGRKDDPEWIFNSTQLQKVLKDTVLSTVKIVTPKIPNITAGQGITLNIDNFIKADTITKDSLPMLQKFENDAMARLRNELNKSGVRPAFR